MTSRASCQHILCWQEDTRLNLSMPSERRSVGKHGDRGGFAAPPITARGAKLTLTGSNSAPLAALCSQSHAPISPNHLPTERRSDGYCCFLRNSSQSSVSMKCHGKLCSAKPRRSCRIFSDQSWKSLFCSYLQSFSHKYARSLV